ncbi:hypothetical protein [Jannaschia pohangensis]|uniref:Uncharacterized protein n=1 Tax=Jannaschia pohangensis TaxID=390807 RepID=A0A1I3LRT2_9RHOB|nr:hypothetical protein [Jannaschia pohangensis]SFI87459.1 hypothetical protein SAMN04488095_1615 [Jannaschia pohangensis]
MRFRQEVARLLATDLHPDHRNTVETLSRQNSRAPACRINGRIPVFISEGIADRDAVAGHIQTWSQTPGLCLPAISRIQIVPEDPGLVEIGTRTLVFPEIVLIWPSDRSRGLRRWFRGLTAETWFYWNVRIQELAYSDGGPTPEQRDEAQRYARRMMARSRPMMGRIARVLARPVVVIMRYPVKAALKWQLARMTKR